MLVIVCSKPFGYTTTRRRPGPCCDRDGLGSIHFVVDRCKYLGVGLVGLVGWVGWGWVGRGRVGWGWVGWGWVGWVGLVGWVGWGWVGWVGLVGLGLVGLGLVGLVVVWVGQKENLVESSGHGLPYRDKVALLFSKQQPTNQERIETNANTEIDHRMGRVEDSEQVSEYPLRECASH